MKRICLRNTPFFPEQTERVRILAAENGYEAVTLLPNEEPNPAFYRDFEVMAGYFPKEAIRAAEALRWLHCPAAGVEKLLDPALYPNARVVLTNSSGAFGDAIAEYLLCGLIMLTRRMPEYMANQRSRVWRRAGPGGMVKGATVTVVGMGDLGQSVARRLFALGATVRGVRRTMGDCPPFVAELYPVSRLKEAVAGADAVMLCLPATNETRGLMDAEAFAAMKRGAYFLNAGRGATVNEAALLAALSCGRLGGAVLDVAAVEPLSEASPLWAMENVIITPHIAGSDFDPGNIPAMFDIFFDNLNRYFRGEPLKNAVDRARGY